MKEFQIKLRIFAGSSIDSLGDSWTREVNRTLMWLFSSGFLILDDLGEEPYIWFIQTLYEMMKHQKKCLEHYSERQVNLIKCRCKVMSNVYHEDKIVKAHVPLYTYCISRLIFSLFNLSFFLLVKMGRNICFLVSGTCKGNNLII